VFSYEDEPIRTESEYRSDKLSITVTRHTDNPYNSSKLVYHVADIYLQDLSSLRTEAADGFPNTGHLPMEKLASRVNALVAINGDYYYGDSSNRTLIVRNGIAYRKTVEKGWRESCILYRDGTVEVFKAKELDPGTIDFENVWQAWQFGPYLIEKDGSARTEFSKERNYPANPRTVFGYYEPGHYCFVVVEGRTSDSAGLNLPDLAKLMADLGCTQAFNFDGGDTSVLYWNGRNESASSGHRNQVDILYLVEPVGDADVLSGSVDYVPEP
jgi:exopolysaccharide biosynthesis protein